MSSNILSAITSHNPEKILESLRGVDINTKFKDGNVLLWGITGTSYNSIEPRGKGNFETVKLLLENGADPNMQFLVYTPLHYATNEGHDDMIVELLNYGAYINSYNIRIAKDANGNDGCFCRTPLIHAIDNHRYMCVEALAIRGAIYNNMTIDYAQTIRDELYDTRKKSMEDYLDYENADKIYTVLKDNYNNGYEQQVTDYIRSNLMTGKKMNYFVGFEN